jgi:hypothetical protein
MTSDIWTELRKPTIESASDIGNTAYFDPWDLWPSLPGGYSQAMDEAMIEGLEMVISDDREKWHAYRQTIVAEFVLTLLCGSDVCNYGSNPFGCYLEDKQMAQALLKKWREYAARIWK